MAFVDEIYEMYKEHLKTNDEDAISLVLNLLNDFDRKEILDKITEMEDYEIYQMFTIYLIEALKAKIVKEETDTSDIKKSNFDNKYH